MQMVVPSCTPFPRVLSQVPTGLGRVSPRLRQKEHQTAGRLQDPDIPIIPHNEPETSSFRAPLHPVGEGQVRLPQEATPATSGRSTGSFASVHRAGEGREGLPAECEDVLSFSTIKLQIGGDSSPQGWLRMCQQHNPCSWMNCDLQAEASPDRGGPGREWVVTYWRLACWDKTRPYVSSWGAQQTRRLFRPAFLCVDHRCVASEREGKGIRSSRWRPDQFSEAAGVGAGSGRLVQ